MSGVKIWQRARCGRRSTFRTALMPMTRLIPTNRITRGQVGTGASCRYKNPFERGRTLLLFEGAGQKCEVFVSLRKSRRACRRLR